MEVPNEVLQKLVCEKCDGYLARGPVHLLENVRYRCGRCVPSEEEQGTRIEAYEELAKLMTFPCRYQHNGCTNKVPSVENEAHEETCPYRKYICPIAESSKCEWTGSHLELLEHCQQDHPANVVENPCKFTHDITRSSSHNYIVWTLGVFFLIQIKVCTATRKIYHSVRLISDPASASNYKYTLCIQNKDSNFSKERKVAPRGCLALQEDNSLQTDINGLLAMLEDFTDISFIVTVESIRNRMTTGESSSANTPNTTPVKTIDPKVECDTCYVLTKPVYRGRWLCRKHAPKRGWCENRSNGCTYLDVRSKCVKHEYFYCQYSTWCKICSLIITSTTRDAHYSQAHCEIIAHRAGTLCTVHRDAFVLQFLIIECNFGWAMCTYYYNSNSTFVLYVYTPLPSDQLHKYKCVIKISHPDTGYTLTYIPTVQYQWMYDWYVQISQSDLNMCAQNNKLNIKIDITKFL